MQSTRVRGTGAESKGGRRRGERAQRRGELTGQMIRRYARTRREKARKKERSCRAPTVGAGMTARAVARCGKCSKGDESQGKEEKVGKEKE